MWRLTALLLVAVASASPQGYNYIAPVQPAICPTFTSVFYDTRVKTSIFIQTLNQVNTQFITTTLVRQQVIPTTIFNSRVQTQPQFQTSIVQQTTTFFNNRVVTQTIPGQNVVQTQFVTSTRVVPQISFITQTQFQTQVVPVEVTRTEIQTINRPVTSFRTQTERETRFETIPGRDVIRTRVQTLLQTSLVRRTQEGNTRFVTSTQFQQQVQTSVVQGQDVFRTSIVNSQQIFPFTSFNTRFENAFTTREEVITRTNFVTQTQIETQFVPQEIISTQIIPNTIFTTIFETRVQPFTQFQTVIQTQYNTPAPVFQTVEQTQTSVIQVPGQDRIVNQQVFVTQQQQQVVFQTVNQPIHVTVTRTITGVCGPTGGFNFQQPTTPFGYDNY